MGISGLLPLLKPIQKQKHLSEFSGQTIAVDAYVWLHRGTYACATDLATGKKTTKYVDYAMHRVRLLRHHGIAPYIVFDGGPLPAKRSTEVDRQKKRAEHLARGHALAAQGKHTQARECYCKCVDVTPQMAFQLIKALRAEGVQYVVAPYEADAQLAYLERTGAAHAILTEDSDLLVFGCRTVLFKLDAGTASVCSVSRADFGGLSPAPGAALSLSLVGWSDAQFRAMAILSGCDYLPSIPGVGLKTAHALLRKHRTPDAVVRALRLEGKKAVPAGYTRAFRRAERVFLHQRVFDSAQARLVCLTDTPADEEWDDEDEAYIGGDIEPGLAQKVARGDACPISLLPMDDINPGYTPRAPSTGTPAALRMSNLNASASSSKLKSASKADTKGRVRPSTDGGLLSFFSKVAKSATPTRPQTAGATTSGASAKKGAPSTPTPTPAAVGRASGKRTLADAMDHDIAARRTWKKQRSVPGKGADDGPAQPAAAAATTSRFFASGSAAAPAPRAEKENTPLSLPGDEDEKHERAAREVMDLDPDPDIVSDRADAGTSALAVDWEDIDSDMDMDGAGVTQEDGYLSPTRALMHARRDADTPELSSPAIARTRTSVHGGAVGGSGGGGRGADADSLADADADAEPEADDADVLSSPPRGSAARARSRAPAWPAPVRARAGLGAVLVQDTPPRAGAHADAKQDAGAGGDADADADVDGGVDLADAFDDWREMSSEIEAFDDADVSAGDGAGVRGLSYVLPRVRGGAELSSTQASSSSSSVGPDTPLDEDAGGGAGAVGVVDVDALEDDLQEADPDTGDAAPALHAARSAVVARGWWAKWAGPGGSGAGAGTGAGTGPGAGKGKGKGKSAAKGGRPAKTGAPAGRTRVHTPVRRETMAPVPRSRPRVAVGAKRAQVATEPGRPVRGFKPLQHVDAQDLPNADPDADVAAGHARRDVSEDVEDALANEDEEEASAVRRAQDRLAAFRCAVAVVR